ncbi:MAG: hypothetical protein LBL26_09230 [Peptococcaceae bacterium]|jgi:hypothetical protein|nr:hypothetical protein [Peptococcaceae bacterium]
MPAEKEEKVRFPLRLSRDIDSLVKAAMLRDNCQSRNEFIEKAVRFYAGHIAAKDGAAVLPESLVSVIRGTLDDSENRISRLLFKLAVELSMTMHVLAANKGVGEIPLARLRGKCVEDVRKSLGSVNLEDIDAYQNEL